jgi:type IV pilus assembly protein PilM
MPTRRPRSANIVGVVVDGDVIKGAQIRTVLGRPRLVRCAEVIVPGEITDQGRIIDPVGFVDALRALWKEGGFRTKHVAFGLDGRDATFRRLALPIDAADHVRDAARYELSSYLPYDLDEAVTDIQEVGRTATSIDVVAVAVRRANVELIAASAASAGLRIRDITLSSTALGLSVSGGACRDNTIVSVDGVSTTIVVRRDGRATVVRVLTGGGGERSTQAADELEEALASVDQFRHGSAAGAPLDDPRIRRFRTVVEEVAAAIRFEESQQAGGEIRAGVDLAGSFGADESLVELMASGVDAPVAVVDPPAWWGADHPFAPFTTAAGVALSAFDRVGESVHLDVPSLSVRHRRHRELAVGLVVAATVTIPTLRLAGAAQFDAATAEGDAESAEIQADVLAARVAGFDEVAALQQEVFDRRRIHTEALAGEIWWPRVLGEIAAVIPDDTFLTGFSLRRPIDDPTIDQVETTATFGAVALDQNGVAAWLRAVESLDGVDEVWLVQSTSSVFGELELPVVAFVAEGRLTMAAETPRSRGLDTEFGS